MFDEFNCEVIHPWNFIYWEFLNCWFNFIAVWSGQIFCFFPDSVLKIVFQAYPFFFWVVQFVGIELFITISVMVCIFQILVITSLSFISFKNLGPPFFSLDNSGYRFIILSFQKTSYYFLLKVFLTLFWSLFYLFPLISLFPSFC